MVSRFVSQLRNNLESSALDAISLKRCCRFLLIILLASQYGIQAQVLETFNKPSSLGIFTDTKEGHLTDSLFQAPDPGQSSAGSLDIRLNLKGVKDSNAFALVTPQLDSKGAQQLTFWIYIPTTSTIPDSLGISIWIQSTASWKVSELTFFAKDIQKGIWFPVSFPLMDSSIANPSKNDLKNHNLGNFGLRFRNDHCAQVTWKGDVFVDNVSLVGAEPTLYSDFKSGLNSFAEMWNNGWKDSIYQVPGPIGDSSGILVFKLQDGSKKTGGTSVGVQPASGYKATAQNFLAVWVYVDTTFPATGYLQVWAQDNSTWNWPGKGITTYPSASIPKNVWYPIYFDLSQASILDASLTGNEFNSTKYPLGKFGLQVDAAKDWTGQIYIGRIEFLNTVYTIPPNWIAANFENSDLGTQGFYVPSDAQGALSRVLDSGTGNGTYVLKGDMDFSKAPAKFAAFRNNVPLIDGSANYSSKLTLSTYIPADMPTGTHVQLVLAGAAALNSAVILSDNLVGTQLVAGKWNTLAMNLDSLVRSGIVDPSQKAQIGVQILKPSTNWAGSVLFDNLTLYGLTVAGQLTGIRSADNNKLPKAYCLYKNYPNPFNPTTIIKYDIPKQSNVLLKVYSIIGKEVATLVNETQSAGAYSVNFKADNLASGIYIYQITAGSFVRTQKMMLLK